MKKLFVISILLGFSVLFWSWGIEPHLLIVKKYDIKDSNLNGIKIVFAGDFHLKPSDDERLDKIISKINRQKPDIVLLGGDFVKGHKLKSSMPLEKIAQILGSKIKAPVYSVIGNHDFWLYKNAAVEILQQNGIKVLNNKNTMLQINNNILYLAGVEDETTQQPDVRKALQNTGTPVILISHSPDVFPDVPSNVNLTVAGHTHGGQVKIPFLGAIIVPSKYKTKYASGFIEENGKKLIVTQGLGTSILPIKFNCFPEIVVIEFK